MEDAKKIPGITPVAPMVWSGQIFSFNDRKSKGRLMGVEPVFFDTIHLPTSSGDKFNDDDVKSRRSVCVIGKTLVENLFKDDRKPLGKSIDVGGHLFQIIGIIGGVEIPASTNRS